jgi:hypothetical protein
MSKVARALIIGAILAAMNLAGMTAVAQAHPSDDPTSQRHRALGQVEFLATADHAVASQQQPTDALELYRRGERASQEQNPTDAVELFRRGERASQDQPTIADTRRPPTEAQVGEPWRHPGNVPVRPPEPSGQPRLARPCDRCAGRGPSAGRWTGRHGRQAHGPQGAGRTGRLITVRLRRSMGLPRPPAAPSPCGRWIVRIPFPWPRQRVHPPVRTRLLQRITSPLTVARDLQKWVLLTFLWAA